jgi:predicted GIY-YIG superfamily endonuclease
MTPTTNLATAVLEAAEIGADGVVYLLHFDQPYRHAAHYTGWTTHLDTRLAQHATGRGARLLAVITQAGIGFTLARTWPGPRSRERALKRQGGASRRCPLCGITARTTRDEVPSDDHNLA